MAWFLILIAGLLETGWAVAMKLSQGFSRPLPSILTVLFMVGSVLLLGLAMKQLPLGTAYAVWTGIGAIGAVLVGIFFLGESASLLRLLSLVLVFAGLVGLRLASS
ncbi:MAG: quaternary ammonium compound efflux SMR transporter SugE [Bacteroidota bacterium]